MFRPEFLNRVDDIVVFHRLDKTHMLAIVDIQLEEFASRLADQRIGFKASDEAKNALVEEGYDPVYGARPLKRTITRRLENPVSRLVVSGELAEGGSASGIHGTKRPTYEIECRAQRAYRLSFWRSFLVILLPRCFEDGIAFNETLMILIQARTGCLL